MADAGADCAIVNGSYSILEYKCNDNRQKYSLKIYNLDVILSVCSILERTAADGKTYKTKFFNLDMILSVGYRVNSRNAVNFRRWASKILKDYLLKGYSINARLISVEKQLADQLLLREYFMTGRYLMLMFLFHSKAVIQEQKRLFLCFCRQVR